MSPRTPPPKAREGNRDHSGRGELAWASDSTLLMRLWDSPLGGKRIVGDSLKLERKGFDQSAQISGEVDDEEAERLVLLSCGGAEKGALRRLSRW
jgi:hypothetical protein